MSVQVDAPVQMIDPSDYRPESKGTEAFRRFEDMGAERYAIVNQTYNLMHTNQTVAFVTERRNKWLSFNHKKMHMLDALEALNELVDESDLDISLPNSVHGYQTAERLRQKHPEQDWLHLTGLIHDVGKIIALWGEPQWATVGDTFVVGCAPAPSVVFKEQFVNNPDSQDTRYNTQLGMYEKNCGLDNVMMSWGHDEYLYQVLKHNGSTLPIQALYMIRYHSFYPWHTGGDYTHLTNDIDQQMIPWVQEFNKFDLYSKCDDVPDVEAVKPYYQSLVDKYCPGLLSW